MLGFYLLIYWLCLIFYLALKDNASLLQLKTILLPQILNRAQNVYQSTARNSPDKCKMSLSMSTTVTSCFRNDFLSWTVSLSIYLHDSVDSKTMKIRPRLRINQNYHLQFQSSSAPGKKKVWSGGSEVDQLVLSMSTLLTVNYHWNAVLRTKWHHLHTLCKYPVGSITQQGR